MENLRLLLTVMSVKVRKLDLFKNKKQKDC